MTIFSVAPKVPTAAKEARSVKSRCVCQNREASKTTKSNKLWQVCFYEPPIVPIGKSSKFDGKFTFVLNNSSSTKPNEPKSKLGEYQI